MTDTALSRYRSRQQQAATRIRQRLQTFAPFVTAVTGVAASNMCVVRVRMCVRARACARERERACVSTTDLSGNSGNSGNSTYKSLESLAFFCYRMCYRLRSATGKAVALHG